MLQNFMTMSLNKHRFSCFPFRHFAILWVVNESGEILIAIEEGIFAGQNFPLPKTLVSTRAMAYSKLGHPALVDCKPARIAGEIMCDLEDGAGEWYINNRSGRYGVNVGRTLEQLVNVADEFARFGIKLQPDFR
jgi:hypothetical protein